MQGLAVLRDGGGSFPDIVLHASRAPAGADPLRLHGFGLAVSSLPGPILTRAWDRGLLDVPGPVDVVHAPSMAVPPARRAALVVTVHDMAWRQVPETFPRHGRRWHEAAFGRVRRRASRVVVPSEQTAGAVADAGVDGGSIVVIPHGADHLPEPDREAARRLLERLGVQGDFLLSVGTQEPRKNLARLLDAYGRALPRLPARWPLVVVGPSGWGERATAGPGAGPSAGVLAAGAVDDATLAGLYQRARLLAYVPLTEGFGFPPVEAMRQGVPVVASAMPSLGGAALVVDPGDVEALADGLVRVATDEGLRADLVARGTERTAGLTWEASARAHVALWDSLS